MPTYVSLLNFTNEGIKDLKKVPEWGEQNRERYTAMGITLKSYYATMGQYDEVVVWEAPSEEVAMTWLLDICSRGRRRSVTLRAFDAEQLFEMLEKVP